MAFSIESDEADRLARQLLTAATGESLTEGVAIALRERLQRIRGKCGARCQADEILGYDEKGLPS